MRCPIVYLQELANDPLNIFKAPSKLQHRLVLSSAYAAGHEAAADADPRHRRRNDHKHHEPKVLPAAAFLLPLCPSVIKAQAAWLSCSWQLEGVGLRAGSYLTTSQPCLPACRPLQCLGCLPQGMQRHLSEVLCLHQLQRCLLSSSVMLIQLFSCGGECF